MNFELSDEQVDLMETARRFARGELPAIAADLEVRNPDLIDASVAKCFSNTIAREVTGDAVQLMGAYGYSREFPMERRLRDSWGWGIAGGAIDIQKTNIASAMVGRRFNQR
jgi:alkylation response protein AidB-like acyl-CoA dehydrogenase